MNIRPGSFQGVQGPNENDHGLSGRNTQRLRKWNSYELIGCFHSFSLQPISSLSENWEHNQKLKVSEIMSVSEADTRNSVVCRDTECLIDCPPEPWKTAVIEK